MISSLLLSMVLHAPAVPAPAAETPPQGAAAPATGTQPPRLVELKPDADGNVKVTVSRPMNANIQLGNGGGGNLPPNIRVNRMVFRGQEQVALADVKDLVITNGEGKEIKKEDALKTLEKGGVVVVSSDGKKVAPQFLKMLKSDVLVLISPELVGSNLSAIGGIQIIGQGQAVPLPAPLPPVPQN